MSRIIICVLIALWIPTHALAVILPGLVDDKGQPVHTADEFDLQVDAVVQKTTLGYRYSYQVTSLPTSVQNVDLFEVNLPALDAVIAGSEQGPWLRANGRVGIYYPNAPYLLNSPFHDPNYAYKPEDMFARWSSWNDPEDIKPGTIVSGLVFESPYPPGITIGYAEGVANEPVFDFEPSEGDLAPLEKHTPYGPGKIIPVIGPVKPAVPGGSKYSVIGCNGGLCNVQLDITGPQDVDGTKYVYQWSGPFGAAAGAQPVVQLPAGTHAVSVSVSDAQGTLLATATMDVVVVDPNPPVDPGDGGAGDSDDDSPGDDDHEEDHDEDDHHHDDHH